MNGKQFKRLIFLLRFKYSPEEIYKILQTLYLNKNINLYTFNFGIQVLKKYFNYKESSEV